MAPEARSKRSPSKTKTDWLPDCGSSIYTAKSLRSRDLEPLARRDWFVKLALAIEERKGDVVQCKMLVKLYFFLRDFVPYGLNERYSHIEGNDVMHVLLSHAGEHQISRHKVSKGAEAMFGELEKWMENGKDWQEALKNAQSGAATDARMEKDRSKKRLSLGGRAPGLHSAASMLAVLVIGHPDPEPVVRLKQWIRKLQIDWMMDQPRHTLSVREGFWKGINSRNISTAFAEEEAKEATVAFLADYTMLFGPDYAQCQKNMRPFLQPWAQDLALEEPVEAATNAPLGPSDAEDTFPTVSPHTLRQQLNCTTATVDLKTLAEWLIARLAREADDGILFAWSKFWETRIEKATNYQDQMLVRSLFSQSLGRVATLDKLGGSSLAETFALLDMSDGSARYDRDATDAQKTLEDLHIYNVCAAVNRQFLQLVETSDQPTGPSPSNQHALQWAEKCFAEQACFFSDFSKMSPFFTQYKKVIALDILRTKALIQGRRHLGDAESRELAFWRSKRDVVLAETTVEALKLTAWQIRSLLLPDCNNVLTDWQDMVFRQNFCPELESVVSAIDLSEIRVMPVAPQTLSDASVHSKHRSLFKLLCDVKQPQHLNDLYGSRVGHPGPPLEVRSPAPVLPATPTAVAPTVMSRLEETLAPRPVVKALEGIALLPAKRVCSPDGRPSKIPRLGLKQELMEDMQRSNEELRTRLVADITAALPRLAKDVAADISASLTAFLPQQDKDTAAEVTAMLTRQKKEMVSDVAAEIRQLKSTIVENVKAEMEQLKRSLQQLQTAHANSSKETQQNASRAMELMTQTKQDTLAHTLGNEDMIRDALKSHETSVTSRFEDLKARLETVTTALQKPLLRPGDDGYLLQFAPTGWEQRAYEALLLRASWYYIFSLGMPDGGVSWDPLMLETTKEMFMDIADDDHLLKAIEHTHVQAYQCPLRQAEGT